MSDSTGQRRGMMRPLWAWPLWAACIALLGGLFFTYRGFDELVVGETPNWRALAIDEWGAVLATGCLFFALAALVRHQPPTGWRRVAKIYAPAFLVFSLLRTTLLLGMRRAAYPLFGAGTYPLDHLGFRYLQELPSDLVSFVVLVGAIHGVRRLQAARARALRAARLEASLARAEARALRTQLQPHFLFNTLHAISATLYDAPETADEMIDRLATLLRASLRASQVEEIPLRRELETLRAYVEIQTLRHGDRLDFLEVVDPAVVDCRVPPMLLQPLVENSVRHGGIESRTAGEPLRIEVRIAAVEDSVGARRLQIAVLDDGRGVASGPRVGARPAARASVDAGSPGVSPNGGLGLRATAERLALLYGATQRFSAEPQTAGGFAVRLELPLRRHASRETAA